MIVLIVLFWLNTFVPEKKYVLMIIWLYFVI